ncbi:MULTISPECIES: hypothetical protein [unclassified Streptomyces]|uniref:hypothetical protein n=1 Tax=unclassified Streptomyces TaxID=2593676 RepID=UPI00081B9A19|nr:MULTISPECIES: hypothetical protein [unclassified Streptomyces]MYQ85484.1 hypothetical protein [Streptomyces sp. SID4936]SCE05619.1 hypothetical protein GA0115234_1056246 [Streptomyces sp. DvalAA-43]
MPDTIAVLGRRMAKLERRVTALERARRAPYPEWRDLPLTGDTSVPDEEQPPQFRANLWDTTEFCGRVGLEGGRATDEQLVALLPEGYWPEAPRTVDVASDARRPLQLDIDVKGMVRLRVQGGGTVRATWISLDSTSIRTDRDDA